MQVVSFFSGCGGLDLGFEQMGFKVVWANELEPRCRFTYQKNHPDTKLVIGDICSIHLREIPNCDGFIGGPPCQSWSVGGKMLGLDDRRGTLFLKYIELIQIKRPKFFVIENVKGILDNKFKDVFADFIDRLTKAGYNVYWKLLDAVKYRIPQNRERIFITGIRKDLNVKYEFPQTINNTPITLCQAIGDIREKPHEYSESNIKVLPNNEIANHDILNSKLGGFYNRGNRRRGWQQPSFTINATADYAPLHPASPKMLFFGHENWNFQKEQMSGYRRLSVRECARIQTFPDSYIFQYDDIRLGYKMVGNAVPPRLARAIAQSILQAFQENES